MQYLFSLLGCTLLPCRYWWEKEFSLWCLWWTWRLVYFYVYWQILSRSWYQKSCEDALQKAANFYKAFRESIYNIYKPQRSKLFNRPRLGYSIYANIFYDITLQIMRINYVHVLLNLKARIIFFYAPKIMNHLAQP